MTDLTAGDLLLTRSAGTVGALIRFGARVRYAGWLGSLGWLAKKCGGVAHADVPADPWYVNHAVVYVGGGAVIEALAGGLTESPASKYDPALCVTVRLDDVRPGVTDFERAALVRFARIQLARHDSYGWLSIASIVVQLLTPSKLDISYDGALICSAFAAQCWEHAGVLLPTRSSLTTMPADLAAMRSLLVSRGP